MRKGLLVLMALLMVTSLSLATDHGLIAISQIQTVADPVADDLSTLDGDTVTVEGWVTFENMSTGGSNFWIADAPGAWNGVNVYASGLGNVTALAFGQKVQIRGVVDEYYHKTEVIPFSTSDVVVLVDTVDWANPPAVLTPTVVSAADLAGGAATAEQWEGVLARIEDVTATSTTSEWDVEDASANSVVIDNPSNYLYGYKHKVIVGQPYEYIEGIVDYTYSEYKLLPEVSNQIKVAEDPDNGWYTQISYFQQVRYSDMLIKENDQGQFNTTDWSYESAAYWEHFVDDTSFVEDTLTVRGIVTMETGLSYAGDGVKFIMADAVYEAEGEEQPWSSIMVYSADSTAFPTLYEGFEVKVRGIVSEYNMTNVGKMTEIDITEPITIIGSTTKPAPIEVTVPDVRDNMLMEMYETAFVYLLNVRVVDNATTGWSSVEFAVDDQGVADEYPEISIDGDTNWLRNGIESPEYDNWATFGVPPVGTNIDSVVGWTYPHYGEFVAEDPDAYVWKVVPLRPLDDIVVGEGPPIVASFERDIVAPTAEDDVVLTAEILDDVAVDSAKVMYKVGIEGAWVAVDMVEGTADIYTATIPAGTAGDNIWYFVQAFDTWDDTSVHSSTFPSDTSRSLFGYAVSDGSLSIADVQYTPYPGGDSRYSGYEVTLTGVVMNRSTLATAYGYDQGPAYLLQTDGAAEAAWNAILVHVPTELMSAGEFFEQGDKITVTGTITESGGNAWDLVTRMISVTSASLVSSDNTVTAYTVSAADLIASPEMYESQLIKVNSPTFAQANRYDWTFDESGTEFLVDDDLTKYENPLDESLSEWFTGLEDGTSDTAPDWIQGIWVYSYSSWKADPRGWFDVEGLVPTSGVAETLLPLTYELSPVYPNPFNPSATVAFQLPENAKVKVMVYNMLGQQVRTLVDRPMVAGKHRVTFDGGNLASGVYFVRFDANHFTQMRKMVLVK